MAESRLHEVVDFLLGVAPLDGKWFGDKPPGEGAFWWRAHLRAAMTPSESGYSPITDNDKRWRILEHGCQWVSFCPTGGEPHSFDPRGVDGLKNMREFADRVIEEQLAILRKVIK